LPVVLLHAFPLNRRLWDEQIEALSRNADVIAPDLPGLGESAPQEVPSIPLMAQSIVALLDQLAISRPVALVGLSIGGYVAFEMLRQFSDRIRLLVLCSTRAGIDSPEGKQNRLAMAEKLTQGQLTVEAAASLLLPKLLGKTTLAKRPGIVEAARKIILQNKPVGIANAQKAMADRRDSTPLLAGIRCPTLVMAGDEDAIIPLEEANNLARAIPKAKQEILPQAGHLINLEDPARFIAPICQFLS